MKTFDWVREKMDLKGNGAEFVSSLLSVNILLDLIIRENL